MSDIAVVPRFLTRQQQAKRWSKSVRTVEAMGRGSGDGPSARIRLQRPPPQRAFRAHGLGTLARAQAARLAGHSRRIAARRPWIMKGGIARPAKPFSEAASPAERHNTTLNLAPEREAMSAYNCPTAIATSPSPDLAQLAERVAAGAKVSAVVASIARQYGAPIDVIRKALRRGSIGSSGPRTRSPSRSIPSTSKRCAARPAAAWPSSKTPSPTSTSGCAWRRAITSPCRRSRCRSPKSTPTPQGKPWSRLMTTGRRPRAR